MTEPAPGEIITFYSYKGGTGRSMALANVACRLARKGPGKRGILMIDWDLEAPGLHRFFLPYLPAGDLGIFKTHPGLIDLFYEMRSACSSLPVENEIPDSFFDDLRFDKYCLGTDIKSLSLMPAGRFDDSYPARVALFNWEEFFNQNPWLISSFARYLSKKFDYVLIDSRTGFTDISSICTALMPERLVVVFTPNQQSLTGALDQVKKSTGYRRRSDDTRPLLVFPLVSRVETAEPGLRQKWRFGTSAFAGYQAQFQSLFKEIYDLADCNLTAYFDNIQIQHVPKYAYGEEIAVLSERIQDKYSLANSYESFTTQLVESEGPWAFLKEPATQPVGYEEARAGAQPQLKTVSAYESAKSAEVPSRFKGLPYIIPTIACFLGLLSLLASYTLLNRPIPADTFTPTFTPAGTNMAVQENPTLTITPTPTVTPVVSPTIQPILAVFNQQGSIDYYLDPLLQKTAGTWEGPFYVCSRYYNTITSSYEIADQPGNCTSDSSLGWVDEKIVALSIDEFPNAQTTLVPPGARQCEDSIDNDGNGLIDFPADPQCSDRLDETEGPPVEGTAMPTPALRDPKSSNPTLLP